MRLALEDPPREPSLWRDLVAVAACLFLVGWGFANVLAFGLAHCNDDAQADLPGSSMCGAYAHGLGEVVALLPAVVFGGALWLTRKRMARSRVRLAIFVAIAALPATLNALLATFSS